MSLALKLALAPLLVGQAVLARRRAPILPEAAGERDGQLGHGPIALRLLIVGDSSAAGVGVDHQRRALAGHLTRSLHHRLGVALRWTLRARSGLTTAQVESMLRTDPPPCADIAVVVTGVNDVIDQVPSQRAVLHRASLADWLLHERRAVHIVFAPLPPVHRFPLLPQPLRHIAGADARRHDAAMALWAGARAAERGDVSHVPIEIELGAEQMASDGFHPGEPVYRVCGDTLAEHIAIRVWPALNTSSVSNVG